MSQFVAHIHVLRLCEEGEDNLLWKERKGGRFHVKSYLVSCAQ